MAGRAGSGRGTGGLRAFDAIAIALVIAVLAASLGALLASRDTRLTAEVLRWIQVAVAQVNPAAVISHAAESLQAKPNSADH
jgi:hypothetical protein